MKQYSISEINKICKQAAIARQQGVIVLDGIHMVQEGLSLLGCDNLLQIVADSDSKNQEVRELLTDLNQEYLTVVNGKKFTSIAPTKSPQGILAIFKRPDYQLQSDWKHLVYLDQLQDPGNVGTIIRTAAATGCDAVLLSPGCCDLWASKCLRASQGAHFYIPVIEQISINQLREQFTGDIISTRLDKKSRSLYDFDFTDQSVCMVLGNEGSGVSSQVIDQSSGTLYIPMNNGFESLNVSQAAAIVLGEMMRQNMD